MKASREEVGLGPGSVQADFIECRLWRSWPLVNLQPKAHHPCTGTSLCARAVKGHGMRRRQRWYCIGVLWDRRRCGRMSVIPHQTCHRQGRLCSSSFTPTSCSCWQLLLNHNLPHEPGAVGAWTPRGLVSVTDYLCLNVAFHLVDGIKIGSLKVQKNETVQKYKEKVLNREKC